MNEDKTKRQIKRQFDEAYKQDDLPALKKARKQKKLERQRKKEEKRREAA